MDGHRHADAPETIGIDPPLAEAQRRVTAGLASIDWALPGSVVERRMRCGKPRCRCKNDPPQLHGPYIQWTRTIDGKTVTKLLTPEQRSRYQRWLDNAARLRNLVTELEALTVQAVKHAEGWGS
ncbi:DUF6788 family protein [Mycobacterium sp.]|uniref:DUF6788 family protein n=1 Tax=Mycobacterium sp. TaxID=1785 RepID=UPI002CF3BF09|nr:DUF6788 family protein [Mycobacterium sp.]HTY31002.1 DUF6788 family protein [Mycobacterium sp.]